MLIKKKVDEKETVITVGPYRIRVSRESFREWEAELMAQAGFRDKEIKAEILRRLGYGQN